MRKTMASKYIEGCDTLQSMAAAETLLNSAAGETTQVQQRHSLKALFLVQKDGMLPTCFAMSGAATMACHALSVNSFWVMRLPPPLAAAATTKLRCCLQARQNDIEETALCEERQPVQYY